MSLGAVVSTRGGHAGEGGADVVAGELEGEGGHGIADRQWRGKSEGRNPKSERNPKAEIRSVHAINMGILSGPFVLDDIGDLSGEAG